MSTEESVQMNQRATEENVLNGIYRARMPVVHGMHMD